MPDIGSSEAHDVTVLSIPPFPTALRACTETEGVLHHIRPGQSKCPRRLGRFWDVKIYCWYW